MIRIGLTQRVEIVPTHKERRDCLDQAWFRLICSLGWWPVPLPNMGGTVVELVKELLLDGFVLTGGNDLAHLPQAATPAPERDSTEIALLHYALAHGHPLLGVCRGLQLIQHYFGGNLTPHAGHVGTRHPIRVDAPALGVPAGTHHVNSYHRYGIQCAVPAAEWIPWAWDATGGIEAMHHRSAPMMGIMWHPEREESFQPLDKHLMEKLFLCAIARRSRNDVS